jgi:hypothetical protein
MLRIFMSSTSTWNEPLGFAYTLGLQPKFLLVNDNFLDLHIVKFPWINHKICYFFSFCGIL